MKFTSSKLLNIHSYFHIINSSCAFIKQKNAFFCNICTFKTADKGHSQHHLKSHLATCVVCKKIFSHPFLLGLHMADHNARNKVCCPFCSYKDDSPAVLRAHMDQRHFKRNPKREVIFKRNKVKTKTLSLCAKTSSEKLSAKNQDKICRPKIKKEKDCKTISNQCKVCLKTFTEKLNAKDHSKLHKLESEEPMYSVDLSTSVFSCLHCSKQVYEENEILEHSKIHTFPCSECTRSFPKVLSYGIHLIDHTNDKKYTCPLCQTYQIEDYYYLHKHINETHLKVKPNQCRHCQIAFLTKQLLCQHVATVHDNKEIFRCVVCQKKFLSHSNLLVHQRNKHRVSDDSEVPLNFCLNCKRSNTSALALKEHLRKGTCSKRYESKRGEFNCDTCAKKYNCYSALRKHYRNDHTDYKPFKCSQCPKSFLQNSMREIHVRVTHSDEKLFSCERCGLAFKQKKTLCKHMVTHEATWRFICDLCGRGFHRKWNLQAHTVTCQKNKK